MSGNLIGLIRKRIGDGTKVLIKTPEGKIFTYGDCLAMSGRIANVLVARGVKPGERVAVQIEKSPEAVMLYLACLRAGAVYLPLNTAYTAAELEYFIGDAEPSLIVCRPDRLESTLALAKTDKRVHVETLGTNGEGSLVEALRQHGTEFVDVPCKPDDLASILYTSGTTGRSKGAMITHGNLSSNASTLAEYWRFTPNDVLLHALPLFHIHGLFVAFNTTLVAGSSVMLLPKFDADEIVRYLPSATVMMGVPTFYVRLLKHPGLTRELVKRIRLFVSGSAPLLSETHTSWRERTGYAILERYGMTETGMNTSNPYDGERVAGTVGFPLPGVELRIADLKTGQQMAAGEIGGMEVRGPNVCIGYWRMPDKTKAEFRADGFFITGDVGYIDDRGYVRIVGRDKDLIISGGFNVYPKEVESEIDLIPGVVESAVIGIGHPDFGEGVTAVVVKQPAAELNQKMMLQTLEERLAKYKLPKRIIFVDELPRNAMGKVEKKMLRETYSRIYQPK